MPGRSAGAAVSATNIVTVEIAAVAWQAFYGAVGALFGTGIVALSFAGRFRSGNVDKTLNALGTIVVGFGAVFAFADPAAQYFKDGRHELQGILVCLSSAS